MLEVQKMMTYPELLNALITSGNILDIRGLEVSELLNVQLFIGSNNLYFHEKFRPLDKVKKYLFGELAWYLSGSKEVEDIVKYSKFWDKIKNEDDTVNSNYGYLVFYKANRDFRTPYQWCLDKLRQDKNTRKAVMLYNDRDYFYEENKDLICTQLQHFFIRHNKLISFVYLRSSDAIKGLTYDIPWWSIVQQQLAKDLNIQFGEIIVTIGSSHIYKSDYELVENMVELDDIQSRFVRLMESIDFGKDMKYYEDNIDKYFAIFKCKVPI